MGTLEERQPFPRISEDGSSEKITMVLEPKLANPENSDKKETAWYMPMFVAKLRKLEFQNFPFLNAQKTTHFLTKKVVHEWCLFQKS